MSQKFGFLTVFLLLLFEISAEAQYRRYKNYEIHGGIAVSNFFGDFGGAEKTGLINIQDIQISKTRPLLYLGGRMDLNEMFSAKLNFFGGMAAGTDEGSISDERNYSYKTWLFELSGQVEWNFWRPKACIGTALARKRGLKGSRMETRLYVFAGAGLVYSLPTIETSGGTHCNGEYVKTSAAGLAVPFGFGARSDINSQWALGFEFGGRFSTSDYLDGLSTEWSKANDFYYLTSLHAIYKIQFVGGKRKSGRPGKRR